jgi:hypothetical protein
MRQVADTLVWLAMIGVVAAVIYFTPRFAQYVRGRELSEHGKDCVTCRAIGSHAHDSPFLTQ